MPARACISIGAVPGMLPLERPYSPLRGRGRLDAMLSQVYIGFMSEHAPVVCFARPDIRFSVQNPRHLFAMLRRANAPPGARKNKAGFSLPLRVASPGKPR